MGAETGGGWQGLRRRPLGGRNSKIPWHAHRTGQGQPAPQPSGGGKSRFISAHEGGRVSRRIARAARQDRHGFTQSEPARPGNVPHPARPTSPYGKKVVHLSHVRFCARTVRFARTRSALYVHAGV